MVNWPLLVALSLALAGGVFFLSRPLPLDYRNGEYRRHLTAPEKAALQRGEVVEKTHQAYETIWRTSYDRGPLRVSRAADGTYAFVAHGHWQRLTKQGQVVADSYPTARYPAPTWQEYLPNGQTEFMMYALRTAVDGDTLVETRIVHFKYSAPADTAYVVHLFTIGNRQARPSYVSFDGLGKQPVPKDWKPSRL